MIGTTPEHEAARALFSYDRVDYFRGPHVLTVWRSPDYSTTAPDIWYPLGAPPVVEPVYQRAGYRSPLPSIRAMVEQAKQDAFCRMHLSAVLEAQRARHPFVARASNLHRSAPLLTRSGASACDRRRNKRKAALGTRASVRRRARLLAGV